MVSDCSLLPSLILNVIKKKKKKAMLKLHYSSHQPHQCEWESLCTKIYMLLFTPEKDKMPGSSQGRTLTHLVQTHRTHTRGAEQIQGQSPGSAESPDQQCSS